MKNLTNMKVHIKTYQKEGAKKKYSVHIQVSYPGGILESCKSHDFELPRAVHKSFDDIRTQIKHKFHSDTNRGKAYE